MSNYVRDNASVPQSEEERGFIGLPLICFFFLISLPPRRRAASSTQPLLQSRPLRRQRGGPDQQHPGQG